ncbi:MAG TPA: molybdopterin-synthase adenylyltransferase MoeB [Gemmatimonadaceae bacterium]|nr:molybdopterin-synthase adenylyltransferase MoeB [Gemmatimonadaceae bacterium]
MLSPAELQRYARQVVLPDIGAAGQERLRGARALIVGAGGLGSPAALYLAAAGVGTIGIVDFDDVDASNLHRQLLHGTKDIGRPKVESARDRLRDVNPHVKVTTYGDALNSTNALTVIRDYDLVVDASDNFPTRYLVNDACVIARVPNVYGSVERFEGQVAVFGTPDGPCYRCLFREPPPPGLVPTCAEAGVVGVLPGLIGTLQATEAIKLIVGVGDALIGRLLLVDAKRMRFRTIEVRRDPACPVCGTREQTTLIDYEEFCGLRAQRTAHAVPEIEPRALAQRLAAGSEPLLVDVREPWEIAIASLANARAVSDFVAADGAIDLPRDRDVIVYCHHGSRSERWAGALIDRGYARISHLRGGIEAWSQEVDPSVPRY